MRDLDYEDDSLEEAGKFLEEDVPEVDESYLEDSGTLVTDGGEEDRNYRRDALWGWTAAATVSGIAAAKELAYDIPSELQDHYGADLAFALGDEVVAGAFFTLAAYYSVKKVLNE